MIGLTETDVIDHARVEQEADALAAKHFDQVIVENYLDLSREVAKLKGQLAGMPSFQSLVDREEEIDQEEASLVSKAKDALVAGRPERREREREAIDTLFDLKRKGMTELQAAQYALDEVTRDLENVEELKDARLEDGAYDLVRLRAFLRYDTALESLIKRESLKDQGTEQSVEPKED